MTNEEDVRNAVGYAIDVYEATLKTVFDKHMAKEITINYIINVIAENEAKKEKQVCFDACKLYN